MTHCPVQLPNHISNVRISDQHAENSAPWCTARGMATTSSCWHGIGRFNVFSLSCSCLQLLIAWDFTHWGDWLFDSGAVARVVSSKCGAQVLAVAEEG